MSDIREVILNKEYHDWVDKNGVSSIYPSLNPEAFKQAAINAMDEYFTERAMELLTYMVKHTSGHSIDEQGNVEFKYKGEWISARQLFENFL
jgi:hypothetical protein